MKRVRVHQSRQIHTLTIIITTCWKCFISFFAQPGFSMRNTGGLSMICIRRLVKVKVFLPLPYLSVAVEIRCVDGHDICFPAASAITILTRLDP